MDKVHKFTTTLLKVGLPLETIKQRVEAGFGEPLPPLMVVAMEKAAADYEGR